MKGQQLLHMKIEEGPLREIDEFRYDHRFPSRTDAAA
jgi:hypothetical protein